MRGSSPFLRASPKICERSSWFARALTTTAAPAAATRRLYADSFAGGEHCVGLARKFAAFPVAPDHPIRALGPGAVTYQLRRLRLHGMIERRPHTLRYHVTDLGWRVALFFTRAYNRLLRPSLAAVLPGHLAEIIPLRTAFDALDRRLNACLVQHNLAA